ncbi:hypothetical protein [Nitrososphaera sp.]|uniref:hypothetical protein n=1 Tax=Nitrososphaera sp. TaxID=1971748 RepID=UPI002EDA148F
MVKTDLRLKIARIYEAESGNSFIIRFDGILRDSARQIACIAGINYESLSSNDRFLLTTFRCSLCGVLPFYFLDLKHLNRIRCGRCSMLVGLNNSGKYGKLKKQIAIAACNGIDESLDSDENGNWQHLPVKNQS